MAPKRAKEKSFIWTEPLTKQLLLICRDFQRKNGHDQPFMWADIAEKFEKKIGRPCHYKVARNKFEHQKKIWRAWDDLRNKETGVGWDAEKREVIADEAWWEMKLKESDKYKRFYKKGVEAELSDLWDSIFGSIVATGKYCVAATMDIEMIDDVIEVDGFDKAEEEVEDDGVQLDDTAFDVDGDDEDVFDYAHNNNTNVNPTNLGKGQKNKSTTPSPSLVKRKRQSPGASLYNQHLSLMGEANGKLLAMFEDDGRAPAGKKGCTLDDAISVIDKMVAEGYLLEGEPLWCFSVDELMKEQSRELFMRLTTDSARLSWLKYKMEKGC